MPQQRKSQNARSEYRSSLSGSYLKLVPMTGIELVTYALRVRCSTN